VVSQLYEPLLRHPEGALAVEEGLASSVSVFEDGTLLEFALDDHLRFHDGGRVTAADVVYAFERAMASPHSRHAHLLERTGAWLEYETDDGGEYVPGSVAVAAVDERTVRVRLEKPSALALSVLALSALAVVPHGVVGDVDVIPAGGLDDDATERVGDVDRAYEAFATDESVGAGPFALAEREDDGLRVERFDGHNRVPATVARIEYRLFDDAGAAYEHAASAPRADWPAVFPVPDEHFDPALLDRGEPDRDGRVTGSYGPLPNGERARYRAAPALHTAILCLNAERVPRPVRRAVADAVSQRALVDDALGGRGRPAVHLTPPALYPDGLPRGAIDVGR